MARRKIEVIIAGDSSSLSRALGQAGASLSTFDKMARAGGGNFATGMIAATPAVTALAGALGALTASAGAAVGGAGAVGTGAVGALGVGFGSIALLASPAAQNLKKVSAGVAAYNLVLDQNDKTSKQALAAQKRLNAIVKENGGPVVLQTVKAWRSLRDAFGGATKGARGDLFKTLLTGLNTARGLIPTIAGITTRSMAATGKALEAPFKLFRGNEFKSILKSLGTTFDKAIGPGIAAVTNTLLGFARIARQSGPYVVQLAKALQGLSEKFLGATKDPDALRRSIAGLVSQTKAWIGLAGALGRVLFDVFGAGAGAGKQGVLGLTDALNRLDARVQSVAGQKALRDFFQKSVEVAASLGRALGPVIKAFAEMSVGVFPAYIAIAKRLSGVMGPLTYAFVAYRVAATAALLTTRTVTTAMTIGRAAATAYRGAMIALTAIRFGWANLKAQGASGGVAVGGAFVAKMSAVAAAGIAGWEIGSWLRKNVPAVRRAGDAIGKAFANAFSGAGEAQRFERVIAGITGNVQRLAQAFRNATNPLARNTAAMKLHEVAARASAAQWGRLASQVAAGKNVIDPTTGKVLTLKTAMDRMRQAEQEAASWAATLKANLNAIPNVINVQINRKYTGGGGAFRLNIPAKAKKSSADLGPFGGAIRSNDVLFPDEVDLASAQAERDTTQAGFDAADAAATRRGLKAKVRRTASAVSGADRASGEKPDAFAKRLAGLKREAAAARRELEKFDNEAARAGALKKIDLKIAGREDAIRFRDALKSVKDELTNVAKTAGDAYRQLRESQIQQALDADLAAIGESADAKELAALQQTDKNEQDRRTKEQLDKALAEAIASGDKEAQKSAQDDIAAYERQKREEELTANIAAAQQAAEDRAAKAKSGLDQEVADYQVALQQKFDAESVKLGERAESYKTFLDNVANIAKGYGVDPALVMGMGSADIEAAINNPWVQAWIKKNPGKPLPGRAHGGPVRAGDAYVVGERQAEVFVPDQSGRIIPSVGRMGGGEFMLTKNGNVRLGSNTDVQREFRNLAFRLQAA